MESLGAESDDPLDAATFQRLVDLRTTDYTYVTALGGVGKADAVYFEGFIAPWVYLYAGDRRVNLAVAPQVVLRMFRGDSKPVTTPSYMPRARLHYFFRGANTYLETLVSHHSNGQDGPFFNADGSVNLDDGNFSTNFVRLSLTSFLNNRSQTDGFAARDRLLGSRTLEWVRWLEVEVPLVPGAPVNREAGLEGLYSFYRLATAFQTAPLRIASDSGPGMVPRFLGFQDVRVRVRTAWRLPFELDVQPDVIDQFDVSVTLIAFFSRRDDVGLFLNYYRGQDYYNLRFVNTMNVFRIGLQANIGNFRLSNPNAPLPQ